MLMSKTKEIRTNVCVSCNVRKLVSIRGMCEYVHLILEVFKLIFLVTAINATYCINQRFPIAEHANNVVLQCFRYLMECVRKSLLIMFKVYQ